MIFAFLFPGIFSLSSQLVLERRLDPLVARQAHRLQGGSAQKNRDGRIAGREGVKAEDEVLPFAASSLECVAVAH